MAGRRPKPTAVKELTGNPGKRPLNRVEPRPPASAARAPRGLGDGAAKFWRRYAPILSGLGVLTEVDEPALRLMAEHFAMAISAAEKIEATGLLVTDSRGDLRKNPLAQVMRDNSAAFRMYAVEFGMTPSSRSRLQPEDQGQMDMVEQLFGKVLERGVSVGDEADPLAEFRDDD